MFAWDPLKNLDVSKPKSASEPIIKIRPESIKLISLAGRGNPQEDFSEKISQLTNVLENSFIFRPACSLLIIEKDITLSNKKELTWELGVPIPAGQIEHIKKRPKEIAIRELPASEVVSISFFYEDGDQQKYYNLLSASFVYLKKFAEKTNYKVQFPLVEIRTFEQKAGRTAAELQLAKFTFNSD